MGERPANLPNADDARLPATYEAARTQLAECSQIDECKGWSDKAAALASYAKQAKDEELEKMARRIRARAIRRAGELLNSIEPQYGGSGRFGDVPPQTSRQQAARDAGLSDDQRKNALRLANVPETDFEHAVEGDDPPTVSALAERGTNHRPQRPLVDLDGRDPSEFALATQTDGAVRELAEQLQDTDFRAVIRGLFPDERTTFKRNANVIIDWLKQALTEVENSNAL